MNIFENHIDTGVNTRSIGEVASAVVYKNQGKFSAAFKGMMSITPLEHNPSLPLFHTDSGLRFKQYNQFKSKYIWYNECTRVVT